MRPTAVELARLRTELAAMRGETVPAPVRRRLAAVMKAKADDRNQSARDQWSALVDASVSTHHAFGIVDSGGRLDLLASRLDVPTSSLKRHLPRWETSGLIRIFEGERARHYAPVIAVQVSALTSTLRWVSLRRADRTWWPERRKRTGQEYPGLSHGEATRVAEAWLRAGVPIPDRVPGGITLAAWEQALQQALVSRNIQRRRSRSTRDGRIASDRP